MVEKRIKNLKEVLMNYRKGLEKKKIRVQQMILFGSYARGTPHDYSDIDIAVILPDFQGGTKKDYLLLDRTAREITPLIEAFPYKRFKTRDRRLQGRVAPLEQIYL
jgi:predicted nucleotidyltransferase